MEFFKENCWNSVDRGYAQPPDHPTVRERRGGLACWLTVSLVPITPFSDGLSIKDARLSRRSTMHITRGCHPIPSYGRKPFTLTFSAICTSVTIVSTAFCDILSDRNHFNSLQLMSKRFESDRSTVLTNSKNKIYYIVNREHTRYCPSGNCTWEYIDKNFILSLKLLKSDCLWWN